MKELKHHVRHWYAQGLTRRMQTMEGIKKRHTRRAHERELREIREVRRGVRGRRRGRRGTEGLSVCVWGC